MVSRQYYWVLGLIGGLAAGLVIGLIVAVATTGDLLGGGVVGAFIFGIPTACIVSCMMERTTGEGEVSRPA